MGKEGGINRRDLGKLAISSAMGVLSLDVRSDPQKSSGQNDSGVAPGIKIGTRLSPNFTSEDLTFFKQLGVDFATIRTTSKDANYEYFLRTRQKLEDAGIWLLNVGNLDLHCDPTLVLGLPGRGSFEEREPKSVLP